MLVFFILQKIQVLNTLPDILRCAPAVQTPASCTRKSFHRFARKFQSHQNNRNSHFSYAHTSPLQFAVLFRKTSSETADSSYPDLRFKNHIRIRFTNLQRALLFLHDLHGKVLVRLFPCPPEICPDLTVHLLNRNLSGLPSGKCPYIIFRVQNGIVSIMPQTQRIFPIVSSYIPLPISPQRCTS